MKNYFIFLIFILFFSCSSDKISGDKTLSSETILKLRDTGALCDTCSSVLLIHHNECTDCSDLAVDSGIVFISNSIFNTCDSLINTDSLLEKHLSSDGHLYLNTNDLKLYNRETFYKLWPDTLTWKDFNKKYKIRGQVVNVSIQKRIGFKALVPIFRIDDFSLLNTAD